jgi:hypothetical protein
MTAVSAYSRAVRALVALATALVASLVLVPGAAAAPLTATKIRIGNHAAFVRVVVDFSGGTVQFNEVEASDPNPFGDGFVRVRVTHPAVKTTAMPVRSNGVFARIAQGTGKITIRLTGADRRFKYLFYFVQHTPEKLVLDLYKSRPPSDAAEITRGRGGCLTLARHSVTRTRVKASGREKDLFEHSLVVRLRRRDGRIHRQKPLIAVANRWRANFAYPPAPRQTGTLEAVALSAKDGTLDCLVQVRVRFGGA